MEQINNTTYKADDGKVWQRVLDGLIGGELIIIGCKDNIINYIQIDKPTVIEEEVPNE